MGKFTRYLDPIDSPQSSGFRVDSPLSRRIDWIDILILGCLAALGLFILMTISQSYFVSQLFYWLVAVFLVLITVRLDAGLIYWFAPLGYVASVIFLALSYLGPTIRGATRWISLAGVQLQPSELVKPFLLLAFAWFLLRFPPRTFRNSFINFMIFLVPFILVFRQPDLGSSLVYLSFWLAMMLAAGFPFKIFLSLLAVIFLSVPLIWQSLRPFQQARIETFLDPSVDPKGAGYNALQSMITVGSGQLFGRGLGRGTQSHLRFLPEFHTDFIFATLIEDLGFAGGLMLLLGYAILLWRMVTPLLKGLVTDVFTFTYSVGLFAMLLSQIFINTGMNMGLVPITGITLPFVSYGGSSIMSLSLAVAVLWVLRASSTSREVIAGTL